MLNTLVSERERVERYWDTRSKEGELNYALFLYATRCLAEGDIEALRQIGFIPEDIPVLDQLRMSDLHALSASRAGAVNVTVDRAALQRLIDGIHRRRTRDRLKRELLRLDAPLPMMTTIFGMNSRQYTALRESMGVTSGVGRPKTQIDDGQEAALWKLWVMLADAERPQQLRHDDLWLIIGREQPKKLRSAWFSIQQWSRDPSSLKAFESERLRLRDVQLMAEESELREKHCVTPIDIAIAPFESSEQETESRAGRALW